jgi:putative YphP/YqiW family bacilliredoxin
MPYPEMLIAPMRGELTAIGARELRTAAAVDEQISRQGTTLLVVNSVCGCAAGKARPGVALALTHPHRPDTLATVFAGADIEATARAREHLAPYPPSSPSIGLFRDGRLVWMMERREIEGQDAAAIARQLTAAFDRFCADPDRQPAAR